MLQQLLATLAWPTIIGMLLPRNACLLLLTAALLRLWESAPLAQSDTITSALATPAATAPLDYLTASSALQPLLAQCAPADFTPTLLDTALPAPSATAILALPQQLAINAQLDSSGILATQPALPALMDAASVLARADASFAALDSCKPLLMEHAQLASLTVPPALTPSTAQLASLATISPPPDNALLALDLAQLAYLKEPTTAQAALPTPPSVLALAHAADHSHTLQPLEPALLQMPAHLLPTSSLESSLYW